METRRGGGGERRQRGSAATSSARAGSGRAGGHAGGGGAVRAGRRGRTEGEPLPPEQQQQVAGLVQRARLALEREEVEGDHARAHHRRVHHRHVRCGGRRAEHRVRHERRHVDHAAEQQVRPGAEGLHRAGSGRRLGGLGGAAVGSAGQGRRTAASFAGRAASSSSALLELPRTLGRRGVGLVGRAAAVRVGERLRRWRGGSTRVRGVNGRGGGGDARPRPYPSACSETSWPGASRCAAAATGSRLSESSTADDVKNCAPRQRVCG